MSKEQSVPLIIQAGMVLGGKLRLESVLGSGGMGSVWRARHLLLDTDVAVKVMATTVQTSANARKRFEREARASLALKSPHVVQVLDYGIEEDTPYIVMELLEGEDLAQRLARVKRLSIADLALVLEPVCKALRRAHELGLVHRDLKPSNIFLSKHGDSDFVKVLDFGIAKFLDFAILSSIPSVTGSGELLGSPLYMSPEQVRASNDIDHRSDLWSLGVIAYEALTEYSPFHCTQLGALLVAICTEPITPPSHLVPAFGAEVDAFFARALSRDLDTRFQSAQEFYAAFSALLLPQQRAVSPSQASSEGWDIAPPVPSVDPHGTTLSTGKSATVDMPLPEAEAEKEEAPKEEAVPQEVVAQEAAKEEAVPQAATKEEPAKAPAADSLIETVSSVMPSVTTLPRPRHGKPSRVGFAPALAIAGLLVVGVLGLFKLRGSDAPVAAGSTANSAMDPVAAPNSTQVQAASVRSQILSVDPPDVMVLVDDVPASVQNGAVVVHGEIGSSHVVRLRKGEQEMTSKVAITGSGIVPEKLVLSMPTEPKTAPTPSAEVEPRASSVVKPARQPAGASASTTATAAPSAKPKDPDFLRRFP